MNRKTQCQAVLAHLRHIGPLTQWAAIKHYRITRLGARIYDLRQTSEGRRIRDRWVQKGGKRFKEYALA